MGRWEPDARGRLEQAALELYLERGFDQTTVAEIAERAGLTERTFFRYFGDKREVLFRGDELAQSMVAELEKLPSSVPALAAVEAALASASDFFEERRPLSVKRQTVIDANPALQERELSKLASMAELMGAALRRRGVSETAAALTAQAGVAVFRVAFQRWQEDPARHVFAAHLRDAMEELKSVAQESTSPSSRGR